MANKNPVGRPAKGLRENATVRVPPEMKAEIDRRWRIEGWESRSDFMLSILAPALDMPQFAPPRPTITPLDSQEELVS